MSVRRASGTFEPPVSGGSFNDSLQMVDRDKIKAICFPENFLWGCATSHFQIEGYPAEIDGRLSDWAQWTIEHGRIADSSTADDACQFYKRFEEDLALLQTMGLKAFRFSFNWPALMPNSCEQKLDPEAVAYYKRFLNKLKDMGVTTFATLFHFTLPHWQSAEGGWLGPYCVTNFARFSELVAQEFGPYIDYWLTINEPMAYVYQGYISGQWPPGYRNDFIRAFTVVARQLEGHAASYQAIKTVLPQALVSHTIHWRPFVPKQRWNPFDHFVVYLRDGLFNKIFPSAVRTGVLRFPFPLNVAEEVKALEGEIAGLKDSADYLAINYYTRELSRFNFFTPKNLFGERSLASERLCNDMGWEVFPEGLYNVLTRDSKAFQTTAGGRKLPVFITENGYASSHAAQLDEGDWSLLDDKRVEYLLLHLEALHKAIKNGVDVRGYLYWSLLDNFEWAEGLAARFGLVRVSYPSQERNLRASARVYSSVAQTNSLNKEQLESICNFK
jgi:beta-glucosidase